MGRTKKVTKKRIKMAIPGSMGIRSVIAKRLTVSRATLTIFLKKPENQDMVKLIDQEAEKMMDLAEERLFKRISEGKFNAIKFYLSTKGKNRGYTEGKFIEHSGNILSANDFREAYKKAKENGEIDD